MSVFTFVTDAGPLIGGGHVMRCLTLAQILAARGHDCRFVAPPEVRAVLDIYGHGLASLPCPDGAVETLCQTAREHPSDGIILDHYGLGHREHEAVAQGRPVLVLDDLADRALGCDLMVNSGLAHQEADYATLVAPETRLLIGPAYAPVRPEFANLRDQALARRGQEVARVLVSLGLTDLGGITARVVEILRMRLGSGSADIVLGSDAPSLPGLKRLASRDPRLVLHVDTPDMARLMLNADIAIGAGGSTTWERAVLGLPGIVMVLAANQAASAARLADLGVALVIDKDDTDTELDRAIVRLLAKPVLRQSLSRASAALCDGLGASRIADAWLDLVAQRSVG